MVKEMEPKQQKNLSFQSHLFKTLTPEALGEASSLCKPSLEAKSSSQAQGSVPWIEQRSSNYHTIAFISHISKVMLEILQARLQHYVNRELPDAQAGFRKGRGTRD